MKFKELSLSPHLNSLSPHVANGDKVGHRWIKVTPIIYIPVQNRMNWKNSFKSFKWGKYVKLNFI
jgi:hypothetical protein